MKLNSDQINSIATLARLELSEKENDMYAEQLSVVLEYIDMLSDVDIEGVEETSQVTGLTDVVREDNVIDCEEETKKLIIDQFPNRSGDFLSVKAVF